MYTVFVYSNGEEFEYTYRDRDAAFDHFDGEEHAALVWHDYINGEYEEKTIAEKEGRMKNDRCLSDGY